ncbi:uncharacterized protein LOC129924038 [Biomphalaria glabrata]|uniref:Uncharacterized protein LOC129924038 n=1 Tax=Biomphalaria glabrata TaxID=6526 RepID=A0A9W2ZF42_BIOGL|nr:uncharacterized protein LOC129924038 [Biomphalaria glabrata]
MTLTYHFLLSVFGAFGETPAKNNDLKPTTNMGKEFYLIVPPTLEKFDATRNTPSLEFHFYGFEGRLKVTLTTNKKIFYRNRKNANVNEIDRFISVDKDDVARIILACSLEGTCHVGVTEQTSWTFRVRGENSFGIYVHYLVSEFSVAVFTPLPVEAWGKKYFAVTLGSDHFIGLVAGKVSVSVVVTFRLEAEYENIVLEGGTYYNNKMAKISIEKQEAFIVSTCKNSKYIGHITGTSFVGSQKFGVISGSCDSGTMTTSCYGSEEQKMGSKDMAVGR